MPVILTKSSQRKSHCRTGSITWCEIVSKRGLLVLNLLKPTAVKALQMRSLSALHLKQSRFEILKRNCQRWSPRGRPWRRGRPREHILKSLTLASKVKPLAFATRSQVLEN